MDAISKSKPIFPKINRVRPHAQKITCAKFRDNRTINDFDYKKLSTDGNFA